MQEFILKVPSLNTLLKAFSVWDCISAFACGLLIKKKDALEGGKILKTSCCRSLPLITTPVILHRV